MEIKKDWCKEEFSVREATFSHRALEEEFAFYEAVKLGDLAFVKKNCEENTFANSAGMGVLSDSPLNNTKYHFIITTAMLTRFCVEGGMELERAFRLSDFYISRMDKSRSIKEVVELHHTMVLDFTERMIDLRKKTVISKSVKLCIDYIYNHLHERITLKDLANYTKLSASYVSRLFKAELNISVSDYIRKRKIEEAKNLLQHTEYQIIEISNYLAFPSQSYFIETFRKETGLTPKKYRELNFQYLDKKVNNHVEKVTF